MTFAVKEIFKTIQGEGANAGRVAVFCRFAGCNLWSGREEDRADAVCKFCDTDFVGGEKMQGPELIDRICDAWGDDPSHRFVVFTGGEPALQLNTSLIEALRARGFVTAMETNGTIEAPVSIDWICMSPKAGTELVQRTGHELKVVWPQPFDMAALAQLEFAHRFVQPMDGPDLESNTKAAIEFCLSNPLWRLSLQTHKFIGIP